VVQKPKARGYKDSPETLGEHIRKVRVERRLLQKDVASLIGVSEDSIALWEGNHVQPTVRHYPAVIGFLGYYPFSHGTENISGKLKQIRYCCGLSFQKCASLFSVSVDAAKRWEAGKHISNPRLRAAIEHAWRQLRKDANKMPI
jgi:DNA-binding transcriptional regulator YiaG